MSNLVNGVSQMMADCSDTTLLGKLFETRFQEPRETWCHSISRFRISASTFVIDDLQTDTC